jgi:drug/metabolite transporter (DMT)-like permease
MSLAMLLFAIEDSFIKQSVAAGVPVGQVLMIFGAGGALGFAFLTWLRGERVLSANALHRVIGLRAIFELMGRLFFTLSLALTTLSSTSAILQATPLIVTLGAMVFFNERIGWRRWTAILIGLVGVMIILRPLPSSFEPLSILAVLGMLGFAGRDLATRAAPKTLSNTQLGVYGFIVMVPIGAAYLVATDQPIWPDLTQAGYLGAAIVIGIAAYNALTIAMRTGDVSVVTPFRYTRLVFAMVLAMVVFGENPDIWTLIGSAVVVASGIYILLRS